MKVIVCGAGQVGYNIARHLANENNDVTLIDQSAERVHQASASLDVQAIQGFASHPTILEQARAQDAEMLIAVTRSDEVNMVACQVGHALFNVPTTIARVRDRSYLDPAWAELFSRTNLAIDVVISPEREIVRAIARRLQVPGALDMAGFADDRVRLVAVRLGEACPVINTPLRQLTELFPDLNVTVVYIVRGDQTVLPHGMDHMLPGDEVYFVADAGHVARAMTVFGHEEQAARRLVILGGGNIGLGLTRLLEETQPTLNLKIIEADRERANLAAEALTRAVVLNGDALDPEILAEANIAKAETVVAVTGSDEINILASVLAKRHGCARAVTLINAANFAPLVSPLGIDAAVSPREITVSSILGHVRRGRIRSVYSLRGGEAEVLELEALATAQVIGTEIRDLDLPDGVMIGAIARDDQVIIPRSSTVIRPNDRVIVFAPHAVVKKVEKIFSVAVGFF